MIVQMIFYIKAIHIYINKAHMIDVQNATKHFMRRKALLWIRIKHFLYKVLCIVRNLRPWVPLKVNNRANNCQCHPLLSLFMKAQQMLFTSIFLKTEEQIGKMYAKQIHQILDHIILTVLKEIFFLISLLSLPTCSESTNCLSAIFSSNLHEVK